MSDPTPNDPRLLLSLTTYVASDREQLEAMCESVCMCIKKVHGVLADATDNDGALRDDATESDAFKWLVKIREGLGNAINAMRERPGPSPEVASEPVAC